MLIPWVIGLIIVIWYAATRWSYSEATNVNDKLKLSRVGLIALTIPIYLVAGIVIYIALILIAMVLSPEPTFILLLKLAAIGGEVALSISFLRWLVERRILRNETMVETTKTPDIID